MAVETLTPLCTQAEMERLFSTLAIELRGDDDDDGVFETGVVNDSIEYASDTIYQYCLDWHTADKLATSLWVHRRATIIACWHYSQRRGNPGQFQSLYEITIAELEKIQGGKIRIPRLAWRSNLTGGVSNFRVDDRYVIKKTRVEQTISTGGRGTKQDADRTVYLDEHVLP